MGGEISPPFFLWKKDICNDIILKEQILKRGMVYEDNYIKC